MLISLIGAMVSTVRQTILTPSVRFLARAVFAASADSRRAAFYSRLLGERRERRENYYYALFPGVITVHSTVSQPSQRPSQCHKGTGMVYHHHVHVTAVLLVLQRWHLCMRDLASEPMPSPFTRAHYAELLKASGQKRQ